MKRKPSRTEHMILYAEADAKQLGPRTPPPAAELERRKKVREQYLKEMELRKQLPDTKDS